VMWDEPNAELRCTYIG